MTIVRILIAVIQAVLRASVQAFLAIVALGAVWAIGIAALVAVVVLALTSFGGWSVLARRRRGGPKP